MITAAIAFGANLIAIPLILRFAHAKGLYDDPDHRKVHDGSIPALGGVGIVVSFLIAAAAGYFFLHTDESMRSFLPFYDGAILAGFLLMHIIGVVDDMVDIPAWRKLFLQVLAGTVIVSGGAVVHTLEMPVLGADLPLGPWGFPLTVIWIVAIANAVNLIDGIDGFCGGVTVAAAAVFAILALHAGNAANAMLAFAFVGAMAGFLVFNLPPARVFMGDGGSLFAGALLATVAVTQGGPGEGTVMIGVPLALLTIPILDTVAALLRRLRRRMPIHAPDREHFHHLLLDWSRGNRRALAVGYPLAVLLGASALFYAYVPSPASVAFLLAGPIVVIGVYLVLDRRAHRLKVHALSRHLADASGKNGHAVDVKNGFATEIQRTDGDHLHPAARTRTDKPE